MISKSIGYVTCVVLALACSVTFLQMPTTYAAEASLFLDPATGVYPIGEPFTVDVRVDTGTEEVGTADVTIAYESDDLTFVSFTSEGSIFSRILVDDSRTPGKIDLSGFVERERAAYRGSSGLVASLTFMPKRNVATQLRFSRAAATPPLSLAASVGELANILTGLSAATYTLVPKETKPPVAAVSYATASENFEITPLPVPNDEWFGTTTVKLSWVVPDGADEMRTLISEVPNDTPTKVYQIPVNSITIPNLVDGTNYFHLQFKYNGEWGSVIHYPVKVDITDPSYLTVKEAERKDSSDPRAAFVVEAADAQSGIVRYEISIDGEHGEVWDYPDDGTYRPEELSSGEHVLTATAYDRAGNSISSDLTFLVRSLESPVLTSVPDRVLTGDTITVRGATYPDANITVFISYNEGEADEKVVGSDASGEFVVTLTDGARGGKYTVWFSVTDDRGATSPLSIKRSIEVSQPFIMLFGSVAVTYLSIIVPLVALIFLLGLILWLTYTWVRGYRRRVRRETGEAFQVVQNEFEELREELMKQIGMLEKANQSRELTREEMRIFRDLSRRLDKIESHIEEEIDDIESVENKVSASKHAAPVAAAQNIAAASSKNIHTVHIEQR